jgi:hypothetical protein
LAERTLSHWSGAVHADSLLTLEATFGIPFYILLVERLTTEVNNIKIVVNLELIGFVDELIFALNLIPGFFIFHAYPIKELQVNKWFFELFGLFFI